jgi:recombination protein RecA
MELINKRGSYYSYGDLRLGQGRENSKKYLRENPELTAEIGNRIRVAAGLDQDSEKLDIGIAGEIDSTQEALPFDPAEDAILDSVGQYDHSTSPE